MADLPGAADVVEEVRLEPRSPGRRPDDRTVAGPAVLARVYHLQLAVASSTNGVVPGSNRASQ